MLNLLKATGVISLISAAREKRQSRVVVSIAWGTGGKAAIGYLRQFPFPAFLSIKSGLIGRTRYK